MALDVGSQAHGEARQKQPSTDKAQICAVVPQQLGWGETWGKCYMHPGESYSAHVANGYFGLTRSASKTHGTGKFYVTRLQVF